MAHREFTRADHEAAYAFLQSEESIDDIAQAFSQVLEKELDRDLDAETLKSWDLETFIRFITQVPQSGLGWTLITTLYPLRENSGSAFSADQVMQEPTEIDGNQLIRPKNVARPEQTKG